MAEKSLLDKLKMLGYTIDDIDSQLTVANSRKNIKFFLNSRYIGEIDKLLKNGVKIYRYGYAYNITIGMESLLTSFSIHSGIGLNVKKYAINKNGEILEIKDGELYEDEVSWCYTSSTVDERVLYYNKVTNKKYRFHIQSDIFTTRSFLKIAENIIIVNNIYINLETCKEILLPSMLVYAEYLLASKYDNGNTGYVIIDRATGEMLDIKEKKIEPNLARLELTAIINTSSGISTKKVVIDRNKVGLASQKESESPVLVYNDSPILMNEKLKKATDAFIRGRVVNNYSMQGTNCFNENRTTI